MTRLLQNAFDEASKLPTDEQDEIGKWLLEEIASERRWRSTLRKSQAVVEDLADEALAEHRAGNSQPLDPDNL